MHLTRGIPDLMGESTVSYSNVTGVLLGNCLCSQELLDRLNPFFICVLLSLFLLLGVGRESMDGCCLSLLI